MRPAMASASRSPSPRSRRFLWLLALVLWLPLAQLSAASHALQHLHSTLDRDRDPPAQLPGACDACIEAAAVGTAAPPPVLAPALPALSPAGAPVHAPASGVPAEASLAYRSRAPPLPHA